MSVRIRMFLKKNTITLLQMRWNSTGVKVKMIEKIESQIYNEIKPRKHPGIVKSSTLDMPQWVIEAMKKQYRDSQHKHSVMEENTRFTNFFHSRRLPVEEETYKNKYIEYQNNLLKDKLQNVTEEESKFMKKKVHDKITKSLKNVYHWFPVQYDKIKSLVYMVSRGAADYAVLDKIFCEIRIRDPNFKPQTIFDFGSGIGTALWAVTEHWKTIKEYIGIEVSTDMIDLSEELYKHAPKKIQAIFHQQYFPISRVQHDLVISAFSLMELPDMRTRLELVSKLWKKTGKYLIIVEHGSNAGFQAVNEARDFILHMNQNSKPPKSAFVFSPCPHEMKCPRYVETDKTPCNFEVKYLSSPLVGARNFSTERYSYVVFKKDKRTEDDNWYRIVRPTLVRSKHTICRMCTSSGNLQEVIFTSLRHGKSLYHCARSSNWGDRLPLQLESTEDTKKEKS